MVRGWFNELADDYMYLNEEKSELSPPLASIDGAAACVNRLV